MNIRKRNNNRFSRFPNPHPRLFYSSPTKHTTGHPERVNIAAQLKIIADSTRGSRDRYTWDRRSFIAQVTLLTTWGDGSFSTRMAP